MGDALGSSTIHAQGLEGLDGVVRSEFDKCLDNVEAPMYRFRYVSERNADVKEI